MGDWTTLKMLNLGLEDLLTPGTFQHGDSGSFGRIVFFAPFVHTPPAMSVRTNHSSCVVLFDIDGTLVTSAVSGRSAGVRAMSRASLIATGEESRFTGADYAGRTDPEIARMLLEDRGVTEPSREQIRVFLEHYVTALGEEAVRYPFRALGAPGEAIERLRQSGARVGLGTGNMRKGGFIKLRSAGIADLFDERYGGFGDHGEQRGAVLEQGARSLDPERALPVVIIGDTPRDVSAAHEIGALCVGIPFASNPREALENAGAEVVLDRIDAALADVVMALIQA